MPPTTRTSRCGDEGSYLSELQLQSKPCANAACEELEMELEPGLTFFTRCKFLLSIDLRRDERSNLLLLLVWLDGVYRNVWFGTPTDRVDFLFFLFSLTIQGISAFVPPRLRAARPRRYGAARVRWAPRPRGEAHSPRRLVGRHCVNDLGS